MAQVMWRICSNGFRPANTFLGAAPPASAVRRSRSCPDVGRLASPCLSRDVLVSQALAVMVKGVPARRRDEQHGLSKGWS